MTWNRENSRRARMWLALAASTFALIWVGGCADICAVSAPATPSGEQVTFKSHRPVDFPDDVTDEGPSARVTRNVNVFGEVNGARQRPGFLVGEVGFQQHTFTDEGYDADVTVDLTGKWLAFSSTRNSEHAGIYLQRVDGSAVTQLTSDGADDAYPAFSPDGKQIAFSSTRTGTWQVYVMDMEGRTVTQVTSGTAQAIHPSWSPDGSRLVYCSLGSRSGQWELWTVDLKTTEKRTIGPGLFPVWSPDKSADRIAFQRARQRGSRWFSLWTLDLVGGEARRVTEIAVSANAAIISPAWSPDGRRLAFATVLQPATHATSPAPAGPKQKGQTDIWTIEMDGTNRQRVTDGRATNLTPAWASDGRIYFISDRGGTECVWSVRAEPNKETAVVKDTTKKETQEVKEPVVKEPVLGSNDVREIDH